MNSPYFYCSSNQGTDTALVLVMIKYDQDTASEDDLDSSTSRRRLTEWNYPVNYFQLFSSADDP